MFPRPIASRDEGKVYRVVSGTTGRVLALLMDTIDGEVRLLDSEALTPRGRLLLGAARTARAGALGPGDHTLATATDDDVSLFDVAAGEARWTVPLVGEEPAIAFSPDGTLLAVGRSPAGIGILRASTGDEVTTVAFAEEPRSLLWDRAGIVAIGARTLALVDASGAISASHEIGGADDEARELSPFERGRFAIAGGAPGRVWVDLRERASGTLQKTLTIDGDAHAEGLAFSGGVLFVATEGGTYRADAPFDALVRWLPPLGGTHDPTRIAAVADEHLAVTARDVRVFRTRS